MTRIFLFLTFVFALVMAPNAFADKLMDDAKATFKPIPTDVREGWKFLKQAKNPTEKKYELGKMLYFEPRLSGSQLFSCHSCHNFSLGGADGQVTSIGHKWFLGPRNTPTSFNSVYNKVQFWDGRKPNLTEQAKGPITNIEEMGGSEELALAVVKSMPEYVELFKKAFPKEKDPVTFENIGQAIAIFESTLLTPNAPFDKYLKGDDKALNKQEKAGLKTFMDKGCANCHNGVNFDIEDMQPFGVAEKPEAKILAGDKGRFMISGDKKDEFSFKVPGLRNVALTAPYFHSGQVWKLEDAVAVMGSSQIGEALNKQEIADVTAFLKTLTGDQPKISVPALPASTDKTPKPDPHYSNINK